MLTLNILSPLDTAILHVEGKKVQFIKVAGVYARQCTRPHGVGGAGGAQMTSSVSP